MATSPTQVQLAALQKEHAADMGSIRTSLSETSTRISLLEQRTHQFVERDWQEVTRDIKSLEVSVKDLEKAMYKIFGGLAVLVFFSTAVVGIAKLLP